MTEMPLSQGRRPKRGHERRPAFYTKGGHQPSFQERTRPDQAFFLSDAASTVGAARNNTTIERNEFTTKGCTNTKRIDMMS
mmetsp:Transcript_13813/g.48789  ORF Transcript_13813/g.48789 Transcript_13813/m.48789 type:complete len:81 (-) Transcript_13813:776-1018(-)